MACVPFVPPRRFGDAAQLFDAAENWYQSYANGMGGILAAMDDAFRPAQDRGVDADSERQARNGDTGKERRATKHPGAEANILKQRVHITVLVRR